MLSRNAIIVSPRPALLTTFLEECGLLRGRSERMYLL